MTPEVNTRAVQDLFADFGRGDVPSVLDRLTDDVEWRSPGSPALPYSGVFNGKAEVGNYFQKLGSAAEFETFEPREFIAQGDRVVVLGFERYKDRSTGRMVENHWALAFGLQDGKINRFRCYEDTEAIGRGSGALD